jgi:putative N-acetylmannosamine-6-phosphate epimerase
VERPVYVEKIVQVPVDKVKQEYRENPVYIERIVHQDVEQIQENKVEVMKPVYQ